MYSFRMSFCTVPVSLAVSQPERRAAVTYKARRMVAVVLMVMEVETSSSGMPAKSRSMSSMESIATPALPTSPAAQGESES